MKIPHPSEQPDEFRAWTLLYLERQLSASEERAFAELLRTSEEARREFAEAAQFDAHLYELRSQETLVEPRAHLRRHAAPERRTAWVPAVVAASLLIAIVLAAALSSSKENRPRQDRTQVVVMPEPLVPPSTPVLPKAPTPEVPPEPLPKVTIPETPPDPRPETPAPAPPSGEKRPAPAPSTEKKTVAVARVGHLEQLQGQVFVLAGRSRVEAKAGMDVTPGQSLQTSRDSSVSLVFADGSRLDLSADTMLRDVIEVPQKQAQLAQGTLAAEVVKQPVPMKLSTPAAELTILGTRFVVTAEAKATRLQVREGQVRFARKKDGATLDVPAGNTAAAADGVDFVLKPVRAGVVLKGRASADLEALYLFGEGKGLVVEDVSGSGEPLDLKIRDEAAVRWLPTGILVRAPTVLMSTGPATKIIESCRRSHELTVETWITPASAALVGPARILTVSSGASPRAFMLGQGEDKGSNPLRFTLRLRTTTTNENGMPGVMTDEGTVKAGLTHLVATRSRSGATHLYVDGQERARSTVGGDFAKWGNNLRLSLGDEPGTDPGLSWLGAYYLVAIYSRSLTPDEVVQNFKAGPTGGRGK